MRTTLAATMPWMKLKYVPINGTASLVIGISSDTMFMKTVRERRTVTPDIDHGIQYIGKGYLGLIWESLMKNDFFIKMIFIFH